ncbi:MAG: hypothetical protein PCFJNLEI_02453 [Verrucomicrobiae bacterium]|nr:hypothetical protein [Verrucomicrobiae bacterium]
MDHSTSAQLPFSGGQSTATIPDTLDLADRAALAINGLGGSIDPELLTLYGLTHFCCQRPHFAHWASADTLIDPKFAESFSLMRVMCGSRQYEELEHRFREELFRRIKDGLYWDYYTPKRPWRNAYAPDFYGAGKDEDFATLPGTGRMIRALLVWRELGDGSMRTEEAIQTLVHGLRRIAVERGDYCYYPEKGGWGEPCSYPRSGWLNTDEAQSETEGGEGAVTCMQSHQIYGAAHWYAVSGDPVAFDLAARLSRYVCQSKFWGGVPDPSSSAPRVHKNIPPRLPDPPFTAGHELGHWYSHWHARAITLRGLLEFAIIASDARIMEFVRRSYEFILTRGLPRTGWVNTYPGTVNQMESCALGDFLGLAIRLSDIGLGDYWDDVDAIVRNQLVEQQLTRADLLEAVSRQSPHHCACEAAAHPGELAYDNVIARSMGTFCGTAYPTSIPTPFVMQCCTGNATQGLYYAWEGCLRETGDHATINLFLNRAGKLVEIASHLPHEGILSVRNKAARRISIRIPHWAQVQATRNAKPVELDWTGRYVHFNVAAGDTLALTFPIAETTARYTVNANTPVEQIYTCTFRGSTLVDISPRDTAPTNYPLYNRTALRVDQTPMKPHQSFVATRVVKQW